LAVIVILAGGGAAAEEVAMPPVVDSPIVEGATTISGTAEPGSTVSVYADGAKIGAAPEFGTI
jgi:hypothetical protein